MLESGNSAPCRDYLAGDPTPEAGGEVGSSIGRSLAPGGRQCTTDVLFPPTLYESPDSIGRDPTIELPQLAGDGVGKRQLRCRREAFYPVPAVQHRRTGELHKDRLSEMG